MRRAIGFVIVLWGLTSYFGQAMKDLETAASASFNTIEVAALQVQDRLRE